MMPLWTMATRSVACGCAFDSVGAPCVAQRVWPMPAVPASGSAFSRASRLASLPPARRRVELPVLERGDAGGIVAAIFEPLQRIDDQRRDRLAAQNADDAAHRPTPRNLRRRFYESAGRARKSKAMSEYD